MIFMTTRKGSNRSNRTTRSNSDCVVVKGGRENNRNKRRRTTASKSTVDEEATQLSTPPSSPHKNPNIDEGSNELPTPLELSKELCKIVDTDRYSRQESLCALENLNNWTLTEDPDFFKWFDIHAGAVKVLDFLTETMKDPECVGVIRFKCIENAAYVITGFCYQGEKGVNKDITTKIATTLVNYDGINTLIKASEEYTGEDVRQLEAVHSVWLALRNIAAKKDVMVDVINTDQAIALFDAGIDVISQLKSVDGSTAAKILLQVFSVLKYIILDNYISKEYFQDEKIFSKCLEVFKHGETRTCGYEILLEYATRFFRSCHQKSLLDQSSDYEMLLPLLVICLKTFSSNHRIQRISITLLCGACDMVNGRKIVERSGVMEPLAALLASSNIRETVKNRVRATIHYISAP